MNYSANDTIGNMNSTIDWFEVYDRYNWNVKLLDYNSAAVSGVNLSLNKPNSMIFVTAGWLTTSPTEAHEPLDGCDPYRSRIRRCILALKWRFPRQKEWTVLKQ